MEQEGTNSIANKPERFIIPVAFILLLKIGSMLGFGANEEERIEDTQQTSISPDGGYLLRNKTHSQMLSILKYMDAIGSWRNLSEHELRRMYLANYYDRFFSDVNSNTGIDKSVLFAYFIVEATKEGIETPIFRKHWNPGGVKYRGVGNKTLQYDDCYDSDGRSIPCAFSSVSSYQEAITLWSGVFNSDRYKKCKNIPIRETCSCFQKAGYHTSNSWRSRAVIAEWYINYTKNIQDARRKHSERSES